MIGIVGGPGGKPRGRRHVRANPMITTVQVSIMIVRQEYIKLVGCREGNIVLISAPLSQIFS
jgi:hypothetical protein